MAYQCDTHPDVTAAVLLTNLDNGDVVALCGQVCLPQWVDAMHAVFFSDAEAPTDLVVAGDDLAAADTVDGAILTGATEDGRVDDGHGNPIEPGGTGPTMAEAGTTF